MGVPELPNVEDTCAKQLHTFLQLLHKQWVIDFIVADVFVFVDDSIGKERSARAPAAECDMPFVRTGASVSPIIGAYITLALAV